MKETSAPPRRMSLVAVLPWHGVRLVFELGPVGLDWSLWLNDYENWAIPYRDSVVSNPPTELGMHLVRFALITQIQ